jgi:hypothetical protein
VIEPRRRAVREDTNIAVMAKPRKAGRSGRAVPPWCSVWPWVRGLRPDELVALVLLSALASLVLVAVTSSAAQGLAHLGSNP